MASERRVIDRIAAKTSASSSPFLLDAAMLIVVAEDRTAARERSEAVIVDMLEGLRR